MGSSFDADVTSVAALGDPTRRTLYRYVAGQVDPVTRDDAAAGVGVARHVAKFHLDKLVSDGLLTVEYRRPAGRSGPGAGRPAKLYRRVDREISLTIPGRRYDLAAHVLASAITSASSSPESLPGLIRDAARDAGRALGHEAGQAMGARRGRRAARKAVTQVLEANGYEPRTTGSRITLSNCPFHSLSREYTDLVCGMNLDVIQGLLQSSEAGALRATLDPQPGRCCVVLEAVE